MLMTDDETFELDREHECQLLEAIAEADRAELVNASELLKKIRRIPVSSKDGDEGVGYFQPN